MTRLVRLRHAAFVRQQGRCFYCELALAQAQDLEAFAKSHGISPKQARCLLCTAEHLHARCDGGKDLPDNIVAACWLCNWRRHKRPHPLDAERYRQLVRRRVAAGHWHDEKVLARCRTA